MRHVLHFFADLLSSTIGLICSDIGGRYGEADDGLLTGEASARIEPQRCAGQPYIFGVAAADGTKSNG